MKVPINSLRLHGETVRSDIFDIFQFIRYKVVECNESWDVLCTGAKGVGKSSTMLSIAYLLDPKFNLDRWAFTTEDLTEMRKNAKPGNVIVSDEMGTQASLSSHNWNEKDSKEYADAHQLDRTERIINVATTLDIKRINNRIRSQYKVLIHIDKKMDNTDTHGHGLATSCIIFFVEENPFASNESERFKRKYFRNMNGERIKRVIIPHPAANIFKQYSVMRDEFQETLRDMAVIKSRVKKPVPDEDEAIYQRIIDLQKQYG